MHSAALLRRLTTQRTLALRATLATRPHVALAAVTYRLIAEALDRTDRWGTALHVEVNTPRSLAEEELPSRATEALQARRAELAARIPADDAQVFGWLLHRPESELLELLSFGVALALDDVQGEEGPGTLSELAQAARLDMREWWSASADGYFAHVPRQRILDVVRETVSPEAAAALERLKKPAMAAEAERQLAGRGWLPHSLQTPDVTRVGLNGEALRCSLVGADIAASFNAMPARPVRPCLVPHRRLPLSRVAPTRARWRGRPGCRSGQRQSPARRRRCGRIARPASGVEHGSL